MVLQEDSYLSVRSSTALLVNTRVSCFTIECTFRPYTGLEEASLGGDGQHQDRGSQRG